MQNFGVNINTHKEEEVPICGSNFFNLFFFKNNSIAGGQMNKSISKHNSKIAKCLAGIHHTTRLRVLILMRNQCALAENRTRAVSDQRNPRLTVGLFDL